MTTSESQRRARDRWDAANVKSILVKLYPKDAELYEWMTERGYRGAWLADLARREFEKSAGGGKKE